jgi:NTP pyrophosphatase (non-canonical NTP hydrolase)
MEEIKPRYTFAEYHAERMAAQGQTHNQRDQLSVGALGLAGEAGEVIELIKKHLYHGRDLPADKLLLELGDVLWYVTYTADALGLTLEDVARTNNQKLRARYPQGFSVEAASKLGRP